MARNIDLGTKECEDAIMHPLKVIRISCYIYVIAALLIPIFSGSGIGIDSKFSFVIIILMVGGCFSCHGRLLDFTPMMFTMLIRTLQLGFYLFFSEISLNYFTFIIIVLLEVGLNLLYLVDKSRYSYIKEEEFVDEFY